MKKRFTEEQIVAILRDGQVGSKTVEQWCRERGVEALAGEGFRAPTELKPEVLPVERNLRAILYETFDAKAWRHPTSNNWPTVNCKRDAEILILHRCPHRAWRFNRAAEIHFWKKWATA
jgi:hypothetical protein